MPELRWTLLILGALFIGVLALWEWRRQRHARGPVDATAPGVGHGGREGERVSPTFDSDSAGAFDAVPTLSPARAMFREPTLGLPDEAPPEVMNASRERIADPPVVEIDDEQMDGLKVEGESAVDEFGAAGRALHEDRPVAPLIPHLSAPAVAPTLAPAEEPRIFDQHNESTMRFDASEPEPASPAAAVPLGADSLAVVEPIVEWPDEESRKIIALRLVSGIGERFAGRAIRLSLAAEGFLLGKFEIFHKPGPDARAVLSAASLTKPGTFALDTMDAQRFGGISLFAVLPGPLSPLATFDELLTTARALNDRLRGALQDERGEPLTPMRSQAIRDSLTAAATADAPVVRAAAAPPTVSSGANPP